MLEIISIRGGMVAVVGDCDSNDGTVGELMRTLSGGLGAEQADPLDRAGGAQDCDDAGGLDLQTGSGPRQW